MTGVEYRRVYLRYGLVAHLLDPLKSPNDASKAVCGREPNTWPDTVWRGTGDQDEYDRANKLPTCKDCQKETTR